MIALLLSLTLAAVPGRTPPIRCREWSRNRLRPARACHRAGSTVDGPLYARGPGPDKTPPRRKRDSRREGNGGVHPGRGRRRAIPLKVQMHAPGADRGHVAGAMLRRTRPGWARNQAGFSQPVVLKAPELWWCGPEKAVPGGTLFLSGRNPGPASRFRAGHGLSGQTGAARRRACAVQSGKYRLTVALPRAWSRKIRAMGLRRPRRTVRLGRTPSAGSPRWSAGRVARVAGFDGGNLQEAVDRLAASGGGTLRIADWGLFTAGTLVIPAGVSVVGEGVKKTVLMSPSDPAVRLKSVSGSAWNQGPAAVHSVGDLMLDHAAVWLAGDGAAISHLTVRGSPRTNLGVAVRAQNIPSGSAIAAWLT